MANASTNNAVYIKNSSGGNITSVSNIEISSSTTPNAIMQLPDVADALEGYSLRSTQPFSLYVGGTTTYPTRYQTITLPESGWWNLDIYTAPPTKSATLQFNSNGGQPNYNAVSRTQQTDSDTISVTIPSNYNPTKTNYTFDGWKINGALYDPGESVSISASTSGVTTTATAQWSREIVTITLSASATQDTITATVSNQSSMPSDLSYYYWMIDSIDADPHDTTGSHTFTGLTKGTTYRIKCGGYTSSAESVAYGWKDVTTTSTNVWIYANGWKLATPYVYANGQWREATAYVYSNGWKQA